jgi:hypothetical protein
VSGIYSDQNGQPGVPGGRLESEQAVRDGLATAYSGVQSTQQEAHNFFVTHGASAVAGHQVGEPGRMGDPDNPLPDAADL